MNMKHSSAIEASVMTTVSNSVFFVAAPTFTTAIGDISAPRLNDWNNTSFSQLCRGKSQSELLKLSQNGDLDPAKREIAGNIYEQCFGGSSGDHV